MLDIVILKKKKKKTFARAINHISRIRQKYCIKYDLEN